MKKNKKCRKCELNELLKIQKVEDIKSVELIKDYMDDNLICRTYKINGIIIEFNYYDDLGFMDYYTDSKKAFNNLLEALKNSVEISMETELPLDS